MSEVSFADLGLSDEVLRAVGDAGYTHPTPIQETAIPYVLMGRDILGCAQTGTGKTASFTLPMIDILTAGRARARMPRTLILEPTRELAAQVAENFDVYGKYHKLTKALIIGGSSMEDQLKLIDRGVDVLIATPGRLLDLFERGHLLLSDVKVLVIDEADRMLDMGFIPDVERIVGLLPKIRQTLFFSATMPPVIKRLADAFLMNPKEISVSPPSSAAEKITQKLVMVTEREGGRGSGYQKAKRVALRNLINSENVKNSLIFCNRKRDVDILSRSLQRHQFSAAALHGDMSQPARTETLDRFKKGEVRLLVCSDVAARGIDIEDMSHVFNFDIPTHAEDYIHRIGRTGRAGKEGRAFTLVTPEDGKFLDAIEKLIGRRIERVSGGKATAEETPRETREAPASGGEGEAEGAPRETRESPASGGEGEAREKRGRGRRRRGRGREQRNDQRNDRGQDNEQKPAPQEKQQRTPERGDDQRHDRPKEDRRNKGEKEQAFGNTENVPAFLKRPTRSE